MNPRLSVVIVNYNTRELLRVCLESLEKQPELLEIIVVDNASDDASALMVQEDFPRVRLFMQQKNRWFCGGNNIGIENATSQFVLLLNPDTVVRGRALVDMVDYLTEHPDVAGVTARMVYPDGTPQRTCSRVPTFAYLLANHTPLGWVMRGWRTRLNDAHWYADWDRSTDKRVDVVPGSCMMMRREEIRLNDALRLYFPEDDIARRVQRPFQFVAGAVIEHHEKAATQTWRATRTYFRDLRIYTHTHHGIAAAVLLWLLSRPLFIGLWLRHWFR